MSHSCSECGKPLTQNANFCTSCGAPLAGKPPAHARWQEKRERILGKQQASGKKRFRTILALLVVAALGGWFYINIPEAGNPVIKGLPVVVAAAQYPQGGQQMSRVVAKVANGKIIIPLDVVQKNKFVRFSYGDAASGLPLLAYVSGEGKIVTAVSVCEPCNSTAFHIKGDKIICNTCGSTWELNSLEAVSGSCGRYPPDALPNTVVGDEIQIDEQLVAGWQRRI